MQIARMLKHKHEIIGELGFFGALLIGGGNLLNAIGKLLSAVNGNDLAWMKHSLLFLSAPGFVFLAWALWQAGKNEAKATTAGSVWLLPLFFNGGLLALTVATKMVKGGQVWLKLLLTVVTIASVAAFIQLALTALKSQKQIIAGLFVLSLGMSLAMALRGNDGTQAAEWAEQISRTISQTIFAFAALKLVRVVAGKR